MRGRPAIVDAEMLPRGGERWDWVLGGLLAALFVFLPAAFGAVEAGSCLVVLAVTGFALSSLLLRLLVDRGFHLARTWLYVPIVLLVVFTALQTLPLPTSLVRLLAPANVAIREEYLGKSITSLKTSISLYPYATAAFVRMYLMAAAVFTVVASLVRTRRQLKLVLAAVFMVGCAEALLSLAQIVTGTDKIYWIVPISGGVRTAGTFVNYSNFSQFMNLSIGAGLALLLVRLAEQHRDSGGSPFQGGALQNYWERNGLVCAGLTICSLAVLASLSRNGALAMLTAATVVSFILLRRSSLSLRGWVLVTIPAMVLIALFVYGFDLVYARLATLQTTDVYDLRWDMARAAVHAWQQFPWWGTGFGTHEMVAPQFETAVTSVLAGHADNDYAQLLEETGVLGVGLVVAFVLGIGFQLIRLVGRGHKPSALAAYGILYSLVAVAIQSATDFGLRLPANLILVATLSGLAVALGRMEFRSPVKADSLPGPSRARPPWLSLMGVLLAIVTLTAAWGWSLRSAYAAYLGERWWAAATTIDNRINKSSETATDDDYTNLITSAQGAFNSDPENVHYGYWLNAYRWAAVSRSASTENGTDLPAVALPIVRRIADELAQVRALAPTYGPPYALEGQLRLFVLREPAGANLIRQGARLANYDPPTCLVAGQLAAKEGRRPDAEVLLQRALQLQPAYFSEVNGFCLHELKDLKLAQFLAGRDHHRLFELAAAAEQIPEFRPHVSALRATAEQALREHVGTGDANPEDQVRLAGIEQGRQNLPLAIDLYRRALGREYQRFDWRLQLAELLVAAGQTDQAIHELKVVLRLRPAEPSATKLLEQLVLRSGRQQQDDAAREEMAK